MDKTAQQLGNENNAAEPDNSLKGLATRFFYIKNLSKNLWTDRKNLEAICRSINKYAEDGELAASELASTSASPGVETDLQNLLAVIHRDGGHYVAAHGLHKAAEDAEKIVVALRAASPVPGEGAAAEKLLRDFRELMDHAEETMTVGEFLNASAVSGEALCRAINKTSATTTTTLGGDSEQSEAGRVKLSGVQDHSKGAQIVGGSSNAYDPAPSPQGWVGSVPWTRQQEWHPYNPPTVEELRKENGQLRDRMATALKAVDEIVKPSPQSAPGAATNEGDGRRNGRMVTIDDLCEIAAECYQLAGVAGAPVRVLDSLSAASDGEPFKSFLPISPDELAGCAPSAPQWVSVDEKLMPTGDEVLGFTNEGHIELGWRTDNDYFQLQRTDPQDDTISFSLRDGQVTYWMPLPPPPAAASPETKGGK